MKQTMTYAMYKDRVCEAVKKYRKEKGLTVCCCTDTIQESYEDGEALESAIETAKLDTAYWEEGL